MTAYYNEFDPKAAATLKELIREGLIAPGDVDDRSIEDVKPNELTGYTQVHLFAGFGIWSLALRMAGWPDTRPVWSASCPCQPFSQAGKGNGFDDERHLWPAAFWLLQYGKRPDVPIYGEQVASPDGLKWLDLVQADLEGIGHSCRYVVLASAGFGAPIIRQRTYWMARAAHSDGRGRERPEETGVGAHRERGRGLTGSGSASGMGGSESGGCGERGHEALSGNSRYPDSASDLLSRLDGTIGERSQHIYGEQSQLQGSNSDSGAVWPGPTNGFWRAADWLRCRDERWRPIEPGTFPLAHGYPERVGILRGAGNAISPQVAAAWIEVTK